MQKKILRWCMVAIIAVGSFAGLSSFTEESESGRKYQPTIYVCESYSAEAGGYIDNGHTCQKCPNGKAIICFPNFCRLGKCTEWLN